MRQALMPGALNEKDHHGLKDTKGDMEAITHQCPSNIETLSQGITLSVKINIPSL